MVLYQISKIGKCNQCNNQIHTSLSTPHFWRFKKIYQCQVEFTVLILPNLVVEHVSLKNLNAATPQTIQLAIVSSKATWKWTMPSSLNKARLICSWEKKEEKDDQLFYFWRIRPHLARWPNLTVTGPKSAPLWCLVVAISPLLRLAGGGKIAVIVHLSNHKRRIVLIANTPLL